jgi:sulfur-carrier protein
MLITVKLFASFRLGRFEEKVLEVQPGVSIRQIVTSLGIPETGTGILLLNGRHGHLEDAVQEGDTVSLFPPVGGG